MRCTRLLLCRLRPPGLRGSVGTLHQGTLCVPTWLCATCSWCLLDALSGTLEACSGYALSLLKPSHLW